MKLFLIVVIIANFVCGQTKNDILQYLSTVYYGVKGPNSFANLPDADLYQFYDDLTFYYEDFPKSPTWNSRFPGGRDQSYPYADTICDCLHIRLDLCKDKLANPPPTCTHWPTPTFLNLKHVQNISKEGIPANTWFEGITFPGEYGFPLSCSNSSLMSKVYAYHGQMWLYPSKGTGIWFNSGKSATEYNKVSWLLKFGMNKLGLGSTILEVMDKITERVCSGYKTRPNSTCETCPPAQQGDLTKCCCHGSGMNLGTQVIRIRDRYKLTMDQALLEVANMHIRGEYGQENAWHNYPNGTFFSIRDVLDKWIKQIQLQEGYTSVGFTREPQHPREAYPAYAYEILFQPTAKAGSYWPSFCSSKNIAVLDPFDDLGNYMFNGFIKNAKTILPLSVWKPRPKFKSLFDRNPKQNKREVPTTFEEHNLRY